MAYPPAPPYPQPTPEGPRTRPTVVTAVVWTQLVTAVALVASAIASLVVADAMVREAMKVLESDPAIVEAGVDVSPFETIMRAGSYIGAGIYVVFAVFYVVLALLNGKGNRPARILSWILSGISLACCGLGQLIGLAGGAMTAGSPDEEYNDEMMRAVEEATPAWANVLDWFSLAMFILGSLVVIVLLATPAANEFFRKDEMLSGPYPGMPPYGHPGQAPYGQAPYGQPGQPGQPPYGQPGQPGQPPSNGDQPPAPPQQ